MAAVTLERLLSQLGLCSRKQSRIIIKKGLVQIAGTVVKDPSLTLSPLPETICVNGEEVSTRTQLYAMLHKPVGYECSFNPQHHESVFSLLPERWLVMDIRSAGRLDVDTSGLLLLSNQGDFIHRIESPKKGMLKYYRAALASPLESAQQQLLLNGLTLKEETQPVRARELRVIGESEVEIAIGEGSYHQIRRMFAAVGNHVQTLHRTAIGEVALDPQLAAGQWRFLSDHEVAVLKGVTV